MRGLGVINFLAFVSFIKRPNKHYVFTVIRCLTILVATFSKIASSNMFFFQNQVFFVCKQKLYNIFCLILNSTKKQNTYSSFLLGYTTLLSGRSRYKIRLFHNPTEISIHKLTLFCLLSKCSNRGIQTTLGEYKPHLSRDMF